MATRTRNIRHVFGGGWNVADGPTVGTAVNEDGEVLIPHLVGAENVIYEGDGGPHKVGGSSALNASALEGGQDIRGLFDFWRQGVAGAPSQRRVIHIGTKVYADGADGVFLEIASGLVDGAIPSYTQFDDLLLISSDDVLDVPASWDQTTYQDLGGTPPNFSFARVHKDHVFAAGVEALPSRLYYSVRLDPEDWVGAGSGSIDIDPGDGDKITGLFSSRDELLVFKGPYKGSIHRITGSASASWARSSLTDGIGAVNHNAIFSFQDDIGFLWSDGTIRSLKAVEAFGDYKESSLSRAIDPWLRDHVVIDQLHKAWAVNDTVNSRACIAIPIDGSQENNAMIFMDYRFSPPRFSLITAFDAPICLAMVRNPDDRDALTLTSGSDDGFVYLMNRLSRSVDGVSGISYVVTTPYINYGDPLTMKTLAATGLSLRPHGNYGITVTWRRDDAPQQSVVVTPSSGGDVLGVASDNEFTLGTSLLGGAQFITEYRDLEEGGEFRNIQYEFSNSGVGEDVEFHGFSCQLDIDGVSLENA